MSFRIRNLNLVAALLANFAWSGCDNAPSVPKNALPPGHEGEAHAHAEKGPHDGHIIELGNEEYHAELTHDEATKTVSVYVLDRNAKNPVPIAESEITLNLAVDRKPMQARLAAAPEPGDPAGQSSRFSVTDEKVFEALEAPNTTGRINLTIAGKPYSGSIEHHEHGEQSKK
jgi:hypothetical protein